MHITYTTMAVELCITMYVQVHTCVCEHECTQDEVSMLHSTQPSAFLPACDHSISKSHI